MLAEISVPLGCCGCCGWLQPSLQPYLGCSICGSVVLVALKLALGVSVSCVSSRGSAHLRVAWLFPVCNLQLASLWPQNSVSW